MEQGRTIAEVAETFGVHRKTVRRVASRIGVTGQLISRRYGSIRVFGGEEVERLRAYFRERMPHVEEDSADEEDEEKVEVGQAQHAEGELAVPPSGHVAEFLDLLADLRDVLARTSAGEGKAIEAVQEVGAVREEVQHLGGQVERLAEVLGGLAEENRELRQVLAARLPGPLAPPSPPPRLRPRVVAEVVLLGWVGLLAGVLGAVVLQRLADVGVVTLPAWWPIG